MQKIIYAILILFAISGCVYLYQSKLEGNLGGNGGFSFSSSVTSTSTTLSAGAASIVLEKNTSRKYAVLTNMGGTIAYLALNSTTTPNLAPFSTNLRHSGK